MGSEVSPRLPRTWAVAAGEKARDWPQFQAGGFISVLLLRKDLGDLRKYKDPKAIADAIMEAYPKAYKTAPRYLNKYAYDFVHEMSVGDFVFARRGRLTVLSVGQIRSDYEYHPKSEDVHFKHRRSVQWLTDVPYELPSGLSFEDYALSEVMPGSALWKKLEEYVQQTGRNLSLKPAGASPDETEIAVSTDGKGERPGLWVTVVDPDEDRGLTTLRPGNEFEWAVPRNCMKNDWLLIWLVGGIGFQYICRAVTTPRPPRKDEHGPAQAMLAVVARLDHPITFEMLRSNEPLSSWDLVRSSMQGAVQKQQHSLLSDVDRWNALRRLLAEHNSESSQVLNEITAASSVTQEFGVAHPSILLGFKCSAALWQVLNLAIDLSRKKKNNALSSSALLFALLEIGRRNQTKIVDAPGFLFDHVSTDTAMHSAYMSQLDDYCGSPTMLNELPLTEDAKENPPPTTANVTRWLRRAQEISEQVMNRKEVDTRHLLAALLTDNKHSRAQKRLLEMGLNQNQLRADFYREVAASHSEDRQREWQRILFGKDADAQFARVLASYASDDPEDRQENPDRLDIKGDVEAFASLIAAENLDPPLSVGLFGEWGSGKSFFMSKLRIEVARLEKAAQKTESVFCSRIVQIIFNAWHYVDENLWASLVTEVFDKLFERISGGKPGDNAAQAAQNLKDELGKAQGLFQEAQKELDVARKDLAKAEKALKELRAKREEKEEQIGARLDDIATLLNEDPQTKQALNEVAQTFGLKKATESFKSLETQVLQLQSLGSRTLAIGTSIFQASDRWFRIATLVVVFLVPILVGLVFAKITRNQPDAVKDLTTKIATWGSLVATLAAWLARQVNWGNQAVGRVEEIFTRLSKIRQERSLRGEAEERGQVESLRQREAAANERVAAAEARIQVLQREHEELKPGRRLQKFIQERSRAADYKQHLGLVSLIRQDFMTLSNLLSNREHVPIQRIVLYIDDLDRCPPTRVVEVLEAIHLILAFKLFVVVVGVDVRWISRSLADRYHNLLLDGSEAQEPVASPHDYLEKIFQIPFWIRAVDLAGSQNLIEGLLAGSSLEAVTTALTDGAKTNSVTEKVENSKAEVPSEVPEQSAKASTQEVSAAQPGDQGVEPQHHTVKENTTPGVVEGALDTSQNAEVQADTIPKKLKIEEVELKFIKGLAAFVGSSPRRIKRFVNIYRLLKASVPQQESASFLLSGSQSGEYQDAIVLLAMLTGSPSLAPQVFRDLNSAKSESSIEDFKLKLQEDHGNIRGREYLSIVGLLEYYQTQKGSQVNLRTLKRWLPRVARFSFRPYMTDF